MAGTGFPDVGCEHDDAVIGSKIGDETHWLCADCDEDWWD